MGSEWDRDLDRNWVGVGSGVNVGPRIGYDRRIGSGIGIGVGIRVEVGSGSGSGWESRLRSGRHSSGRFKTKRTRIGLGRVCWAWVGSGRIPSYRSAVGGLGGGWFGWVGYERVQGGNRDWDRVSSGRGGSGATTTGFRHMISKDDFINFF